MSAAGLQVGKLRSMNYRWEIQWRLLIKLIANEIFNEEHKQISMVQFKTHNWYCYRFVLDNSGLSQLLLLGLATLLSGTSEVATWSFEGPLTLDLRLTSWISSFVGKLSPRTLWPMAAWTSVDVRLLNLMPQIRHFIESQKRRNMFSIFFKRQNSGKQLVLLVGNISDWRLKLINGLMNPIQLFFMTSYQVRGG